jgi:hypothetical protein
MANSKDTAVAKKLLKSIGINKSSSEISKALNKVSKSSGGGTSGSSSKKTTTPTGSGVIGPDGKDFADTLRSIGINVTNEQVSAANKKVTSGGGNAPTSKTNTVAPPTTNLQPGSTGSSVKQLQDYLVSQKYMTQDQVNTGYGTYGPQTTAAVKKMQETLGVNNSSGPGYYGPQTIAATTKQTSTPIVPEALLPQVDPTNPFLDEGLPATFDTWPPEIQATYLSAVNAQTKAIESGKVVNPNIELSPEILRKFKDQAIAELDPYYQEKFSLLDNEFNTSIDRLMADYNKNMGRVDTTFKQTLGTQAQSEAEQGTAFSSGRQDRQARTVDLQNQALTDTTTEAQRLAQDTATSYEKLAGSDKLRSLNIPGLTNYQASTSGVSQAGTRSLYNPLGNIALGEYNKQKETDLASRASELEKTYRANRELNLSTY